MKPRFRAPPPRAAGSVPMSLDSGAHSLYNRFFSAKTVSGDMVKGVQSIGMADFSYLKSPEFRKYLDGYMQFLVKHGRHFEFVVTLDIIYNPEATWDVYKEMKSTGLKVLPVYHYGEDVKWLKRYMEDTDYIGMGGIGQHTTKAAYVPFGERSWKIICDARGVPRVKVHGFAMSSFDFMSRWPWYSVDSTTAFTFSRMGAIMLPHKVKAGEGFNFAVTPSIFPVSLRRGKHERHIGHRSPDGHVRAAVREYLSLMHLTEEDVQQEYVARDISNLHFMNQSMRAISRIHSDRMGQQHDIFYYASGSPTATMPGFLATIEHLEENDALDHLYYLGTYFPGMRRPTTYLLERWHGVPKK